MDLKLTYEEITSLDLYGAYESDAERKAVERVTDAATAKAAWALYEKLEASDRRLTGDVIGPLWGAGYWAGWDSARDALKRHIEAAGIGRPND